MKVVDKLFKTFSTLALLTAFLPVIFAKKYTVHYETLGDRTYSSPRFELFAIPIFFIVMMVLTMLWRKELEKYFDK